MHPTPHAPPLRILIIDDEPANLRLAIELLRDYGFVLMSAIHGEDGLLSAREGSPDLILLDITMPPPDGFAVCAQLKADPATRDIPVIFLTALNDTESKLHAFQHGVVDYITKPFDPRELLARVILQLDRQRMLQRLQQRLEALEQHSPAGINSDHTPSDDATAFTQVVAHLRQDLAANPSLDTLATIAGTNRTSLNHKFQLAYGVSVFEWLREERLAEAARLLRTTQRPILEVANAVGYSSNAGLTNAFRKRFDLSPSDYRNLVNLTE